MPHLVFDLETIPNTVVYARPFPVLARWHRFGQRRYRARYHRYTR